MTDTQQAQTVHDQLASRYLDLTEQIEQLQQQRDAVKHAIRQMVGIGTAQLGTGVRISVTPNRRLNLDKIRGQMTEQQIADCTISVLSNPLIKRHVSPELVEACMDEVGDPIVRVN